jgi:hypothetical protein
MELYQLNMSTNIRCTIGLLFTIVAPTEILYLKNKIPEVQIPVQAYKGRKGRPCDSASLYNAATNASTGPVDPIMVSGCPEVTA